MGCREKAACCCFGGHFDVLWSCNVEGRRAKVWGWWGKVGVGLPRCDMQRDDAISSGPVSGETPATARL